ncbi:MAG: trypsin-like peptidase domain-containing protein [Pirellulaceae bacterium]|nr:trypsin-like peptidase domain-containing protein [Pirellulaceae bacterium]
MTPFTSLVALVALSGTGDAVLLQFASENCPPCRAMQPTVSRLVADGYPVQRIDVDKHPEMAKQFGVRGVPAFVLVAGSREVARVEGATSYDRLAQMFGGVERPAISPPASLPPATEQASLAAAPASDRSTLQPTNFRAQATPDQAAIAATVRLRVEDARGFGFGTGTIIDVHDSEALVVTCGHLFRESQGKGRIVVDLFAPGASQPVEGQLIACDLDRDIALVSIRPNVAVSPMPVAPPSYAVRPRDPVFSVGCDKGAAASVRPSEITAVNKYRGKPNFTAAGAPVDGRSGGGLFTAEGLLIGICNAADPADNEGLYAGLASIHWQLDQIGQSEIYQRSARQTAVAETAPPSVPTAAGAFAPTTGANPAFSAPVPAPDFAATAPRTLDVPPPSLPAAMPSPAVPSTGVPTTPASFEQPRSQPAPSAGTPEIGDDTELVVIIRSKQNPQQRSEIYVVDQATPELLTGIVQAARQGATGRTAALAGRPAPAATRPPENRQPVIRGQFAE